MRGEYRKDGRIENLWPELPPHARRILKLCGRPGYYLGTTSACAENTGCQSRPAHHSRNYLRMRGEYLPMASFFAWVLELPPHARRILRGSYRGHPTTGTTSACAENTTPRHSQSDSIRNYLRMRGEYVIQNSNKEVILELPPHARRIREHGLVCPVLKGTTSACAENTHTTHATVCRVGNYLRMRGEYNDRWLIQYSPVELPPHARRIRDPHQRTARTHGTTSACAENTPLPTVRAAVLWNYLRMRGEYRPPGIMPKHKPELPPHARRIPLMAPTRA